MNIASVDIYIFNLMFGKSSNEIRQFNYLKLYN